MHFTECPSSFSMQYEYVSLLALASLLRHKSLSTTVFHCDWRSWNRPDIQTCWDDLSSCTLHRFLHIVLFCYNGCIDVRSTRLINITYLFTYLHALTSAVYSAAVTTIVSVFWSRTVIVCRLRHFSSICCRLKLARPIHITTQHPQTKHIF